MNFICANGRILPAADPVWMADNRGFRYGDGLFETMRVINGRINLADHHFERFFTGLSTLKFEMPALFTPEKLQTEIVQLCHKNRCFDSARVRLAAFRGNGGLYDPPGHLRYLVECWPVAEMPPDLNENGLVIGVYPNARKSCDIFSNLKSANFLPYVMAAQYAWENKLNDCLVLNTLDQLADATIANLFIIKDGIISTPAPNQGCVVGVMRKYLLEEFRARGPQFGVLETAIGIKELLKADEVFLSNAMYGIKWVKQYQDKIYSNTIIKKIYKEILSPLFKS